MSMMPHPSDLARIVFSCLIVCKFRSGRHNLGHIFLFAQDFCLSVYQTTTRPTSGDGPPTLARIRKTTGRRALREGLNGRRILSRLGLWSSRRGDKESRTRSFCGSCSRFLPRTCATLVLYRSCAVSLFLNFIPSCHCSPN
jgi:hypothetical protein